MDGLGFWMEWGEGWMNGKAEAKAKAEGRLRPRLKFRGEGYFPIQKVILPDNQGITSSQEQISNRRLESVGKEELKKGRWDEAHFVVQLKCNSNSVTS